MESGAGVVIVVHGGAGAAGVAAMVVMVMALRV